MVAMILETSREVVKALGGPEAVSVLCGVDYRTASGWQSRFGAFPPRFFVAMKAALRERGLDAPDSLWKMVEKAS